MARPRPPVNDEQLEAITDELVRLTLPHHPTTDRRELRCPIPEGRLTK